MSRHLPDAGEPKTQVTLTELISAAATLAGIVISLVGAGLVIFQPGTPTLSSSGGAIILFLIGAVVTAVSTVLPGELSDLWTAWKARRSGSR